MALHSRVRAKSRKSPSDEAEPAQRRPARRLVANNPQAWLMVLFPHVQVTEMLSPFPFQHLIFPFLQSHASFITGPLGVAALPSTQTGTSAGQKPSSCLERLWGGGRRVVRLRTPQLISAHTDLTEPVWTEADTPSGGGVRGTQCAWPVQTPPASHVHCNRCCHRAREDTDASGLFALNPGSPRHTARWHVPARGRGPGTDLKSSAGKSATADHLCEQVPALQTGRLGMSKGERGRAPLTEPHAVHAHTQL